MDWLNHSQVWLHDCFWKDDQFQWWEIVGLAGNAVFFSRIVLQWYVTEKMKRVVVPVAFWWLSLLGSLMLLFYAIFAKSRSLVFILSFAFTWIPYLRNIIIQRRHDDMQQTCPACETVCMPHSRFCSHCGAALATQPQHSR